MAKQKAKPKPSRKEPKSLMEATLHGTDEERLEAQMRDLAQAISECDNFTARASLHRQYRETMNQLAEVRGDDGETDEIGEIRSRNPAG